MAHSIRKKLRGLVAAFAAVLVALSVAPGAALAEPAVMTGGSLKVYGRNVNEGDNIELYKIVDIVVDDESNELTYKWTDGVTDSTFEMTLEQYLDVADGSAADSDAKRELGDKVAQVVINGEWSASAKGTVVSTDDYGNWAYTFTDLESGQYLILVNNENDPTRVYPATIATVAPEAVDGEWAWPENPAQVSLKASEVEIIKNVSFGGLTSDDSIDGASNGDLMRFTIYADIPEYRVTEGRTFTITDMMSQGIDLVYSNRNTWQLRVGGSTVNAYPNGGVFNPGDTLVRDDFTITLSVDGRTLSIAFNPSFLEEHSGDRIQFSYWAEVTDAATYESALTNTASMTFSKYNWGDETETQDSNTIYATVYGARFLKVADDTNEPLSGAVFDVYKADATIGEDAPVLTGVTSGEDGIITVDGLGAGSYVLHETSAPAPYSTTDREFTIESKVNPETYAGWQYDFTNDPIVDEVANPAIDLPSTGEMGTIAFTAAGIGIMAAAASFIIRSRKSEN